MRHIILLSLVGLCMGLAGCESLNAGADRIAQLFSSPAQKNEEPMTDSCPAALIAPELDRISEYADPLNPTPQGLLLVTRIERLTARCLDVNGQNIVQLTIAYSAQLGPAGRHNPGDTPSFSSPTFVAMIGPDGAILSKNNAAISANFPPATNTMTLSESLRFPLPSDHTVTSLMLGFQLDDQQLANNRRPAPALPLTTP